MHRFFFISTMLSFVILVSSATIATAQTDKELLGQLVDEEQEAINALVLYPTEIRSLILEATLYPEALIKMESIQLQTSKAFRELMAPYPQATQQKIWDLTRYPNLITQLSQLHPTNHKALDELLTNYPEPAHAPAREVVTQHSTLLFEIDALEVATASAFDNVLQKYSPQTSSRLRQLSELPEVLSILTENIRLTILVGDIYRNDPDWVIHKADSMHMVVARENAQELENWKASLENNPEVKEELIASAENYADTYTYDDEAYNDSPQSSQIDDDLYYSESDDLYYDDDEYFEVREEEDVPNEIVVHHHYDHHYPYWYGYPHWYTYPRWRPLPYWYDWGFYIGPSRTIVVFGLPSFHFTNWYFFHPRHHTYWPHLSTHFVNHYYGHRGHGSSISVSVNQWHRRNKTIINKRWMQDDGQLPKRFKEYGEFETARKKYNKRHPRKTVSQKEYADRHVRRYPQIAKTRKSSETIVPREPVEQPSPRQRTADPKTTIDRQRTKPESSKKDAVERKRSRQTTVPKVNKAREFHKDIWEKSKKRKPSLKSPKVRKPKSKSKSRVPKRKKINRPKS